MWLVRQTGKPPVGPEEKMHSYLQLLNYLKCIAPEESDLWG